ncbi:MAG: electron transfer flavoprotein alpha subunit [Chloroflexota bacterium]|jgi:electron transfer flavoprotein alpha subunit|nr:electron transfer flavoprotein alpha subunit [Chloroflexota bacterium]
MTAPTAAPTEAARDFSDHKGIWVYVQHRAGVAAPVAWQLLGVGRTMAQQVGVPVAAVVLGSNVKHLCDEAIANGADTVYYIDDPVLNDYRTQPYAYGMASLIRKYKPEVVLYGSTIHGRDVAGAVATMVKTGLAADATQLEIEEEGHLLHASRPDFGGKLMSTILCKRHRPQMATCRPGVFPTPDPDPARKGEVISESLGLTEDDVLTRVLEFIPETRHVDLSNAEIIVSGGRGLGGPKSFDILYDLAEAVSGVVGASRAAVMAGWIPYQHQIGQTGQTVRPRIYIACGISGAIQHLVGMQESDIIIAINSDPEAPILKMADYGIVGDMFQIVPALTRRLKERLAATGGPVGDAPTVVFVDEAEGEQEEQAG